MDAEYCKAGPYPCPKQRDRAFIIDQSARITFFGPSTRGVNDAQYRRWVLASLAN